jgi:mono/diheme cytochrome c family protein
MEWFGGVRDMMSAKNIQRRERAWQLGALITGASLCITVGPFSLNAYAQSARLVDDGVYVDGQAESGQALYMGECAVCHGRSLAGGSGPPLTGDGFVSRWSPQPLSDLVDKIQGTMPENAPGELSRAEAASLVAYMLQVGGFPAGSEELSADGAELSQIVWSNTPADQAAPLGLTGPFAPPVGNLAEVMRGIFFPSSNLLFNVQGYDPGADQSTFEVQDNFSWVDWGAGIYSGWQIVDYAAIALAEASPLFLTPGRLCENGQPVPVDRADWIQYTADMVEAGKAAYRASQTRDQAAVSEVTNVIAEACYNCHEAYRDKPGGSVDDPSNKAARCIP